MTSLAWVVAGVAEAMVIVAAARRGWWDWGRPLRLMCRLPGSSSDDNRCLFLHLGGLLGAALLHAWFGGVALPFMVVAFAGILWSLLFLSPARDRNDSPSVPNTPRQGGAVNAVGDGDGRDGHLAGDRPDSARDSAS